MPPKAKQHIIPRVHLRQFCDAEPPLAYPLTRRFTPSVWVHNPHFIGPSKRKAPGNLGWERHAYKLIGNDVDPLLVEDSLAAIEAGYGAAIKRVSASGSKLTQQDELSIIRFVGAMHARTREMMTHQQAFWNQINTYSQWGTSPNKGKVNEPWGEVADAGKRQIQASTDAFANVVGPHTLLLENRSPMPFITSDMPVIYLQLHSDELISGLGIPEEWMYKSIPRSAREFCVFCALTPTLAIVASRFFPPQQHIEHKITESLPSVFGLNELTRTHATSAFYSSSHDPYGNLAKEALRSDQLRRAAAAARSNGIELYTERERYWLSTTSLNCDDENPFNMRFTFRTNDLITLRRCAEERNLIEATAVSGSMTIASMRSSRFVQIAENENDTSIIESMTIHTPEL